MSMPLADLPTPSGDTGSKVWPDVTSEEGFIYQLMPNGKISYATATTLLPALSKGIDIWVVVPFFMPTLPTGSDELKLELFYRSMINPGDNRPTAWLSKTVIIDVNNAPAAANDFGLVLFKIPTTFNAKFQGMGQILFVLARRSDDTVLDDLELINPISALTVQPGGTGPDTTNAILVT